MKPRSSKFGAPHQLLDNHTIPPVDARDVLEPRIARINTNNTSKENLRRSRSLFVKFASNSWLKMGHARNGVVSEGTAVMKFDTRVRFK